MIVHTVFRPDEDLEVTEAEAKSMAAMGLLATAPEPEAEPAVDPEPEPLPEPAAEPQPSPRSRARTAPATPPDGPQQGDTGDTMTKVEG